jgi:formylglycine-generating enzyme
MPPRHRSAEGRRRKTKPLSGGKFSMDTDDPSGYPADGEGPVHEVELPPFRMGTHAVTNREFASFAKVTRHVTTAE